MLLIDTAIEQFFKEKSK